MIWPFRLSTEQLHNYLIIKSAKLRALKEESLQLIMEEFVLNKKQAIKEFKEGQLGKPVPEQKPTPKEQF